jgi:predicted transcriptional regulator
VSSVTVGELVLREQCCDVLAASADGLLRIGARPEVVIEALRTVGQLAEIIVGTIMDGRQAMQKAIDQHTVGR